MCMLLERHAYRVFLYCRKLKKGKLKRKILLRSIKPMNFVTTGIGLTHRNPHSLLSVDHKGPKGKKRNLKFS